MVCDQSTVVLALPIYPIILFLSSKLLQFNVYLSVHHIQQRGYVLASAVFFNLFIETEPFGAFRLLAEPM